MFRKVPSFPVLIALVFCVYGKGAGRQVGIAYTGFLGGMLEIALMVLGGPSHARD